ncbi:MAG: hypothetical protein JSW66_19240 [Phycisphaerales bacterium]|nr:MAG: hypothetical protein JSW66_19240 [Phycisphaerales bacterium]
MKMKLAHVIVRVFVPVSLLMNVGCELPASPPAVPAETNNHPDASASYALYAPEKVDIMPLTELVPAGGTQGAAINLYVSLLDAFGSQMKSPAVFRFELYEYVQRSAEPKGKRAVIWADVDLADPASNNQYWRDFLRAYEFRLPFEQAGGQNYILQVTCLCPNGSRLSSELMLRRSE